MTAAQVVRQLQWGCKDSVHQRLTDFRGAVLSSSPLFCFLHSWISEGKKMTFFCLHQEMKQRPCQKMGLSCVLQSQGFLWQPRLYVQEKALGRSVTVWEDSLKIHLITKPDSTYLKRSKSSSNLAMS